MTHLNALLTDQAIRNACDGDGMLHDEHINDRHRSRSWTKLTRLDARVSLTEPVGLDPIPAEPFSIWEAVGRR